MLVATTRAPSGDPGTVYTGERGPGVSLSAFTVSIPPEQNRRVGEVQWPRRLPADPEREFATLGVKPLAGVGEARGWLKQTPAEEPARLHLRPRLQQPLRGCGLPLRPDRP